MNKDLKVGSVVEGTVVGFRQGSVSVLLPGEVLGRLRVAEASWLGSKADGREKIGSGLSLSH